ncbi:outer membrane beta-barrel protein [Vibrio harveyi]|uniref:outer membrane beta-barrel protein n=1 Tax=Vibrio harveyi TaxID=669 RepID=UPI00211A2D76|nr:outer membrane beta-barrel protein [Vibrio harveyi]EKO3784449.1 outer membrane beta-barrel protein [Vibrio harveyi]MCQ9073291.1 outer membrane beta-barrel protein [Vibrio harveyi]HDM8052030.1 outer membrane beta-barrel protein [Vibrio harveyi]
MMNKAGWTVCLATLISSGVVAGEWEIEAGGFFSRTDTKLNAYDPYLDQIRTIDFESDLDLKEFTVLPYVEVEYYFNKKHSVYLDWRSLHREATRTAVTKPFEITVDGTTYAVQAGSKLTTELNIDIARLGYGYQFYTSDKWAVDVLAGLHVMWLSLGLDGKLGAKVSGVDEIPVMFVDDAVLNDVTAPLPDLGIRAEYSLTQDWILKSHAQVFYLAVDDIEGYLFEVDIGAKYFFTDQFSMMGSFNYYEVGVDYESDNSALDVTYRFYGPMLTMAYKF